MRSEGLYIYITFHPKTEYTFFSHAHGMFSRIDHMLVHQTSLNTFKRIENIPSIFSDHNGMKLEIYYRKKNGNKHKHIETKQHATKNPMSQPRNQRGNQKIPQDRTFPGSPVVKTSPSNAGGAGSIPSQGAKIPHDLQP